MDDSQDQVAAARLRQVRERLELSRRELAALIGEPENTVNDIERGKKRPSWEYVRALRIKFPISMDWLVYGEGDMFLNDTVTVPAERLSREAIAQTLEGALFDAAVIASPDDFVLIPSLGIEAGASRGRIAVHEPGAPLAFRRDWFVRRRLNPKTCATVTAVGPSMVPLLFSGDTVLLNQAEREIRSGMTYVFRLEDEIMVKHLHWLPGGVLNVISANQDFQPFPIEPNQIGDGGFEVLGRVRGSSRDWD